MFGDTAQADALAARGQTFAVTTSKPPEIGAATGVEFRSGGNVQSAAEPVRRGGGDARVVKPPADGGERRSVPPYARHLTGVRRSARRCGARRRPCRA